MECIGAGRFLNCANLQSIYKFEKVILIPAGTRQVGLLQRVDKQTKGSRLLSVWKKAFRFRNFKQRLRYNDHQNRSTQQDDKLCGDTERVHREAARGNCRVFGAA